MFTKKSLLLLGLIVGEVHTKNDLLECIAIGNYQVLEKILTKHRNKSATLCKKDLNAAVRLAARKSDLHAIQLLIKAGAQPPLFATAQYADPGILECVLEQVKHPLHISDASRKKLIKKIITRKRIYNLKKFYEKRIIRHKDITAEHIDYARRRSNPGIAEWLINTSGLPIGLAALESTSETEGNRKRKRSDTEKGVSKKSKKNKEDKKPGCSICLEPFDFTRKNRRVLPCYDVFHKKCIKRWLENSTDCPLCKRNAHKPLPIPKEIYNPSLDTREHEQSKHQQHHPRYFEVELADATAH